MLTPEQLTAINEGVVYVRLNNNIIYARIERTDYEALLDEIKRLQAALIAKDAALAQYSDWDNWRYEPIQAGQDCERWLWLSTNPLDIAERAMLEGHDNG